MPAKQKKPSTANRSKAKPWLLIGQELSSAMAELHAVAAWAAVVVDLSPAETSVMTEVAADAASAENIAAAVTEAIAEIAATAATTTTTDKVG